MYLNSCIYYFTSPKKFLYLYGMKKVTLASRISYIYIYNILYIPSLSKTIVLFWFPDSKYWVELSICQKVHQKCSELQIICLIGLGVWRMTGNREIHGSNPGWGKQHYIIRHDRTRGRCSELQIRCLVGLGVWRMAGNR